MWKLFLCISISTVLGFLFRGQAADRARAILGYCFEMALQN